MFRAGIAVAAFVLLASAGASQAQSPDNPLVVYGNYCGPGNRGPGRPPIDALDAACARHDRCTGRSRIPACTCHEQFELDADRIAHDPRQPPLARENASTFRAVVHILPCDASQHLAPPRSAILELPRPPH